MYPEPSRQSFRREFIRNGRITKISGGRSGYLWSHETACGIGEDILGRIRFSLLCEIQMVLVKLAHCPHPLCDTLSYCGLELFFHVLDFLSFIALLRLMPFVQSRLSYGLSWRLGRYTILPQTSLESCFPWRA
jgi:hypothetical protein